MRSRIDFRKQVQTLKKVLLACWQIISFVLLLVLFISAKSCLFCDRLINIRLGNLGKQVAKSGFYQKLGKISNRFYSHWTNVFSLQKEGTISRLDLIDLSLRNMRAKKTRTLITIGGMTIGIGVIVFLVSMGYGIEKMVVTRVARLDEMRQADVNMQSGSKARINDKTLSDFTDIPSVEMVLPLIAVVGRVSFNDSVSDMAVYGVTSDYLKQSAIKPISGKIFESNNLFVSMETNGRVAGVATDRNIGTLGEVIQAVDYQIDPTIWVRVRQSYSTKSKIIGYTKKVEGVPHGEEVWGVSYDSDDGAGEAGESYEGTKLGKWLKVQAPLWENLDGEYLPKLDDSGNQVYMSGYIAKMGITVFGFQSNQTNVLGLTTSNDATQSAGGDIDWVEIASEAGLIKPPETKTVDLDSSAVRQAVVNRAMLAVLGLKESDAVGKKFKSSFVVVGDLLSDSDKNIESTPAEYTIVGVTPEDKAPVFYVPFIDLRSLGIGNYSQVKVVVKNQTDLSKTRRQIESMGFLTLSVADTVAQINSLFTTARTILMLLGMVALAVASLGMFNTLTISLLERTREVGLMKAMGMKSFEIMELFLTESMIMGFFGGVFGIFLGLALGKIISLFLTAFAVFKGVGIVDLVYIPLPFTLVIISLSLFVGLITGIYPARRAKKISALNALRYE